MLRYQSKAMIIRDNHVASLSLQDMILLLCYEIVTFDAGSQGTVAMVIYEWTDAPYLGKITSVTDEFLPPQRTYICTSSAEAQGFCTHDELGRFILDLPAGKTINDTTFWSARVQISKASSSSSSREDISTSGFWDNPDGNPTPPKDEYTSPWKRDVYRRDDINLVLKEPIQYLVRHKGYYCVAIVPLTVTGNDVAVSERQESSDAHPVYNGVVLFRNTFDGKLPSTDYPKVNFYLVMFIVYATLAAVWGWLCYQNLQDLLPLQYYLSGLVGLLVIEMVANWAYYRYLNAHGRGTASTAFLIVVSLGLSVVKESLGRTMLRCQILAGAHFIFGILYAVGIVELELESTSALILLMFVIPLAFTLSGFLLWIMYALNATIAHLRARKQRYKLSMFEKLHKVLMFTVLVIAVFFVVSSFSFSGRLAEDYAAKTWENRWWLLDGWLALLYLFSFSMIAYLWHEIAQDEEDAEDYDLEALENRTRLRDDDEATLVGGRREPGHLAEDSVVFEIGDDDDEHTPVTAKSHHSERLSGEQGGEEERRGLMHDSGRDRND
ncbi:hypothetical protein D9758_002282 [Tetrapyrgos nigripes]|uniref:Uncharacterized protein n=1 Tax=Tetrapyrgos nigripes TaxID=182062 RepID=A0A8H5GPF9_9AGAR|nr:hypothetical protein D9758_002282 [Tetrapyrgos nigripes]